jgi:hypothetical protein
MAWTSMVHSPVRCTVARPTDRLIVEWRIDAPHVRRRYEARHSAGGSRLMVGEEC